MIYYIHLFILCTCICGHTCTTVLHVQLGFCQGWLPYLGVDSGECLCSLVDALPLNGTLKNGVTSCEFYLNS